MGFRGMNEPWRRCDQMNTNQQSNQNQAWHGNWGFQNTNTFLNSQLMHPHNNHNNSQSSRAVFPAVACPQTFNSTGTVTKINDNCGVVNDEVFFFHRVCQGQIPRLGDWVSFESTFSSSGIFRWNADRVQILPQKPNMSATYCSGNGNSQFGHSCFQQNSHSQNNRGFSAKQSRRSAPKSPHETRSAIRQREMSLKKLRLKNPWFDEECKRTLESKKAARQRMLAPNATPEEKEQYRKMRADLRHIVKRKKRAEEKKLQVSSPERPSTKTVMES